MVSRLTLTFFENKVFYEFSAQSDFTMCTWVHVNNAIYRKRPSVNVKSIQVHPTELRISKKIAITSAGRIESSSVSSTFVIRTFHIASAQFSKSFNIDLNKREEIRLSQTPNFNVSSRRRKQMHWKVKCVISLSQFTSKPIDKRENNPTKQTRLRISEEIAIPCEWISEMSSVSSTIVNVVACTIEPEAR